MPTYDYFGRFLADYGKLSPEDRKRFKKGVVALVEDLKRGDVFRAGLRVRSVEGHDGVFELTWAPDGRATFEYGKQQRSGEPHIVWRRVGTHDIFRRP